MYWITQHCDYDVHVLNYALSNKWFEFELNLNFNTSFMKISESSSNGSYPIGKPRVSPVRNQPKLRRVGSYRTILYPELSFLLR
jgi:hypothetical protein